MEDELLYRRIKYFALIAYWFEPPHGRSETGAYRQHTVPKGYFPTIDEAREEAAKKKFGKEILDDVPAPRINVRTFRYRRGPSGDLKPILRGHRITEVFIFTADGKTGYVQGGDLDPVEIPGTKENTWVKEVDNPYLDTYQY